jgi:hypothetical protein
MQWFNWLNRVGMNSESIQLLKIHTVIDAQSPIYTTRELLYCRVQYTLLINSSPFIMRFQQYPLTGVFSSLP